MAADKTIQLSVKVNSDTGALEVVGAKLRETGKTAKETGDSFLGLKGETAKLFKEFLPFASASGVAWGAISFFRSAISAAEEHTESIRKLKFNLEASGVSWEQNAGDINAWSEAIQAATRFDNTVAIQTLERLIRVTGDLSSAQRASQLAMGISVSTGKDLSSTTELLTNIINNNARATMEAKREFGGLLQNAKGNQEIIDILIDKYGKAAIEEDSYTKSTKELSNAFDDLKKNIGLEVIPVLTKITEVMADAVKLADRYREKIINIASAAGGLVVSMIPGLSTVKTFADALRGISDRVDFGDKAVEQKKKLDDALNSSGSIPVKPPSNADEEEKKEEEKKRKAAQMIEQIDLDLSERLAAIGEDSLKKRQAQLTAEMNSRRAKIVNEVNDETKRKALLEKMQIEEFKRNQQLALADVKMRKAVAMETASTALEALSIVNNMQESHTKAQVVRAKAILALEKAIAIAKILAESAGKPWLAAAQIALVSAQFAQQVKAIDTAADVANQGTTQFRSSLDMGGGSSLEKTFSEGGGTSGGGGGSFAPGGGGGGGGGAGVAIVIQPGAIVINPSFESLDLSNAAFLLRRLGDEVARGTTEGVQFALRVNNQAAKNAALAV